MMNKHVLNKNVFNGAAALGAVLLTWVAAGFVVGNHLLALVVTLVIAGAFAYGVWELHRFRQATAGLQSSVQAATTEAMQLDTWLATVPTSLRNAVRLRIEGERTSLPGPALTPYLVGLLVMLGMLGTFLGMVVTLNGAVFALDGTTDLQAMRNAFSAPIKGLGLAFGTSVAGVASSALLGLLSALCRRERLQAGQALDAAIASTLRRFSLSYQRQEAFAALQAQSEAMPRVMGQLETMLQTMVNNMERMGQQLNERMANSQEQFHQHVQRVYTNLAQSVDQSLRESLHHSAQTTASNLQTVVQTAMAGMAADTQRTHTQLLGIAQQQLENMATQSQATASSTLGEIGKLLASTEALVQARAASEAQWTQEHAQRMEQLASRMQTELAALRDQEAQRGDAAVARLGDLQSALTQHLSTLGTALEAPITQLIHTAAEAPRAAAEVIVQMRQEISNSMARDNDLLQERSRILQTLNDLLASIGHASTEQRKVIDALVASSAVALQQAGNDLSDKLGVEATKLADVAAHVGSSAVEVSSLSEAFGFAVRSFAQANDKLIDNLQRIESTMEKSMLRSDEQLAYYVAQAREIIDLSMSAHARQAQDPVHEPAHEAA